MEKRFITWYWVGIFIWIFSDKSIFDMTSPNAMCTEQNERFTLECWIANCNRFKFNFFFFKRKISIVLERCERLNIKILTWNFNHFFICNQVKLIKYGIMFSQIFISCLFLLSAKYWTVYCNEIWKCIISMNSSFCFLSCLLNLLIFFFFYFHCLFSFELHQWCTTFF